MNTIEFTVNGTQVKESGVRPTVTLLNYLRENLALTGTKEGCAEGDCGACTVVILDLDAPGGPKYRAINSCIVLLPSMHGRTLLTVEGLRDRGSGEYHPAQEAMVEHLGSQCGYCTPGITMSMFEACYRPELKPTAEAGWQLDDQMCGNLCRCTGYRPIRDAALQVAGSCPADRFSKALADAKAKPPQARELSYSHEGGQRFWTPTTLEGLWDILDAHPEARFVAGCTDLGLEVTIRHQEPAALINLDALGHEFGKISHGDNVWEIGALVAVSDLEAATQDALPPLARMVRYFGARQIKHRATVGGNLCTASPIGDLAPALLSLGAIAVIQSRGGVREIPLAEFFTGYRETALEQGDVLAGVRVPDLPAGDVRASTYKVSKRQELDISTVSAGFYLKLTDDGLVEDVRIAFGGVAATPLRVSAVENVLLGQRWDLAAVELAAKTLQDAITPLTDLRGSSWYRRQVASGLLRGFFEETARTRIPKPQERPTGAVQVEANP